MRNRLSCRLENLPLLWVPYAMQGLGRQLIVVQEVLHMLLAMMAPQHKLLARLEPQRAQRVWMAEPPAQIVIRAGCPN